MSRLTGADAYGLMEAYNNVYAPQELTEEQVWEEVENWVNSLIEEGYDLSDYTWEEMYESYLEEKEGIFNNDITRGISNYARSLVRNPQNNTAANSGQFGRYVPGSQQVKTPTTKKPTDSRLDSPIAGKGPRDNQVGSPVKPIVASTSTSQQGQGGSGSGRGGAGATAPTGGTGKVSPTKPASPTAPARPSSSATASTADKIKGGMEVYNTQKKAGDMKGAAETGMNVSKMKYGDQLKPKTPNPLMQKTFGYQTGNSPKEQQSRADKIVQSGAVKALAPTPAAKVTPAAPPSVAQRASGLSLGSSQFKATAPEVKATNTIAAKTTPTPVTPKAPTLGSKKPGSMVSSHFDPFDVIKGHLLDEGYADTEESALAIMANMSEEWRESIFESIDLHEKLRKGTKGKVSFTTGKDSNYDQAMTEKNPQTGRQRGTSPMHKTMGAHSKARSDQHDAEQSGDREGAQRHAQRRGRLATVVYNKTGKIIDRADND